MPKCVEEGCKANAMRGQDKCFMHSTDKKTVERRRLARSKGGIVKHLVIDEIDDIGSLEGLRQVLEDSIRTLRSGHGDEISRQRAIAYCSHELMLVLEKLELSKRLRAIEDRIGF